MATKTWLKFVQDALSAIDSDEVEAIDETIESQQVSDLMVLVLEEILNRREWEYTRHRVRQLDAPASGLATALDLPSDVKKVEKIKYKDFDTSKFKDVTYKSPEDFIELTLNRDVAQSNIEALTINDGVDIGIFNDRAPSFWTSFDESEIIFDAVDTGTEVNLTPANSFMMATIIPQITPSDTFVPDLPEPMYPLFQSESISRAWVELKQSANAKAEQLARRQYIKMRELERRVQADKKEINYGR